MSTTALWRFLCTTHCYTLIMVGRAGASQDAPGSLVTGYANPVRLTTSVIGVSCGELLKLTNEDAIMATIPTQAEFKEITRDLVLVTTALRSLRKVTPHDVQSGYSLSQMLNTLQAERTRLVALILPYVHSSLNINGEVRA
ncbi:ash family protein [Pseudocitrobacter faecalis]